MNNMDYQETINYLFKLRNKGSLLGLASVQDLVKRMGEPPRELKIIHIAGSTGKGSTAAITASILQEAGYKTGLFSSL